ncbi:hypothetical protein [uncultured Ruegeria sp.]|uniref:hypothetical protein n=1 Tax=uncultured Ruegeria sp. TaxID=259304 RepID=UPI002615509A|nr:hypothetical protein [uncultured Ruegeria sp.]
MPIGLPNFFYPLLRKMFVSQERTDVIEEIVNRQSEQREIPTAQACWDILDAIDVKATALLTHISLMTAIVGIVFVSFGESRVEQIVVLIEMIAYLILGVMCLQCFRLGQGRGSKLEEEVVIEGRLDEIAFRWDLHRFCLNATTLVTWVFVLSMVVHVFIGDLPSANEGTGGR